MRYHIRKKSEIFCISDGVLLLGGGFDLLLLGNSNGSAGRFWKILQKSYISGIGVVCAL